MSEIKSCPVCKSEQNIDTESCFSCGYPFKASPAEQSKFIGQLILKKSTLKEGALKIKRARIALWIIGGYFIISTLILYFSWNMLPIINYIPGIFFGLLFVGFGFLTFRLPAISIIIPLVLLFAYWIFSAILDSNNMLSGLFFKIAILMILGYALVSVFQAKKLKKESDYLNRQ